VQTQIFTLFLSVTFYKQFSGIFLNGFEISIKSAFLEYLYEIFKVLLALFSTLKPNLQATAQNIEKLILLKFLRISL
jgi:hypothetical protein